MELGSEGGRWCCSVACVCGAFGFMVRLSVLPGSNVFNIREGNVVCIDEQSHVLHMCSTQTFAVTRASVM